jgi:hypothetical protein
MLLSLQKRFLFVANTKCASTTVELELKRWCEVALPRAKLGKHMPYRAAVRTCKPLLRLAGLQPEQLFRFGVVRDPLDWVVSWYNYLARPEVASNAQRRAMSTVGVSFADFAAAVVSGTELKPWAKIGAQHRVFMDQNGEFALDYLIPAPRLEPDLLAICAALGIKRTGRSIAESNASTRIVSPGDVPEKIAVALRQHFASDLALYDRAMAGGFGKPGVIVQRKRRAVADARESSGTRPVRRKPG